MGNTNTLPPSLLTYFNKFWNISLASNVGIFKAPSSLLHVTAYATFQSSESFSVVWEVILYNIHTREAGSYINDLSYKGRNVNHVMNIFLSIRFHSLNHSFRNFCHWIRWMEKGKVPKWIYDLQKVCLLTCMKEMSLLGSRIFW